MSAAGRLRHVLAPLLVTAGALALRLQGLGARSVWTDEGSTWTAARGSFADIVKRCVERETSPPLYYLLTHAALWLGQGEAQLRLVSALASTLLVWVTYRFARLYAGRNESLAAAALLALSPFQLMYAQEARSYALAALLTIAALYLFARAILLDRPRAWLPYVAVSALGIWTQSITLLGTGVQAVLVLGRPDRRRVGRWLLAQALVAALYLPWVVASWGRGESAAVGHWYIRVPGLHDIVKLVRAVLVSPVPLVRAEDASRVPGLAEWMPAPVAWAVIAGLVLVPFALALPGLRARWPRGRLVATALAALLLPPAVVLVASRWTPLWLPRFFVFLTVPFVLLVTHGLARMRPRPLRVAWAVALALLYVFATAHYQSSDLKEDWRSVSRDIAAGAAPGRTLVLVMFDEDPFRFYDSMRPEPLPTFEVSHPEAPLGGVLTARQMDEVEAEVRRRTVGYDEVWVVQRSLTSESRRVMAARTDAAVGEGRQLVAERIWTSPGGPVFAHRYAR